MYYNPVTLRAMLLQPFLYLYLRRTPANRGTLRAHSEHTHGTLMAHTQHTVKNGHAGKKRLGYRIMPLMVCRHALIFMVFYSVLCVCHECAMSVLWVCSVCATFVLTLLRQRLKVEGRDPPQDRAWSKNQNNITCTDLYSSYLPKQILKRFMCRCACRTIVQMESLSLLRQRLKVKGRDHPQDRTWNKKSK